VLGVLLSYLHIYSTAFRLSPLLNKINGVQATFNMLKSNIKFRLRKARLGVFGINSNFFVRS
jgi:hypothetical protein